MKVSGPGALVLALASFGGGYMAKDQMDGPPMVVNLVQEPPQSPIPFTRQHGNGGFHQTPNFIPNFGGANIGGTGMVVQDDKGNLILLIPDESVHIPEFGNAIPFNGNQDPVDARDLIVPGGKTPKKFDLNDPRVF